MSAPQGSTALRGLKVLDLTRVRAGPACCRVLGDFGADIIKIDAPEGLDKNAGISGDRHGYDMLNLHRNKRSLTLNLKDEDGRALFLELVKGADVVVENFRPDVKTRLGIDYEALSAVNKRIVLASISGFGQTGPAAGRAGFDQIAQGMGGLMGVTGFPGEAPLRAGTAIADLSSGIFAATGILIALTERTTSGKGQWVQTSLLQSQIAMMDFQAARYLVDGDVPAQGGNDHPTVTPMGVVGTSDGHINLGVGGDGQWQAFCDAIDRPDLKEKEAYSTMSGRTENRAQIWNILRPIFKTKTSAQWIELLDQHSVPVGPIYRMDEVFADPQVQHLGMAQAVNDPVRGDVDLVALPIDLSRTPSKIVSSVPDAGEHTNDILAELGLDADRIADLRARNVI
ncbi:CaiB/BaiF CoA transferase family protein [Pseudahrensia aquimaris]|uniref:CaiB/BaiF CoA transferase family protein n=1 Tax=Pseudahrensia aquimaris TaxID=744461 RepID=A0ABW3FKC4_9HYPH